MSSIWSVMMTNMMMMPTMMIMMLAMVVVVVVSYDLVPSGLDLLPSYSSRTSTVGGGESSQSLFFPPIPPWKGAATLTLSRACHSEQ